MKYNRATELIKNMNNGFTTSFIKVNGNQYFGIRAGNDDVAIRVDVDYPCVVNSDFDITTIIDETVLKPILDIAYKLASTPTDER